MAMDPTRDSDEAGPPFDAMPGPAERGEMPGRGPALAERPSAPLSDEPADESADESAEVPLDDLDEATIVSRAQDGDLEAFEWLVTTYQGGVFRLAFRMLSDHAEAEDVVQETFIAAWRNLPTLSSPQAFIPWLYRSATNKCFDLLRSRQRRPSDSVAFDDENSPEGSATPGHGWTGGIGGPARTTIASRTTQDPALHHETEAQMRALAELLQTVPAGVRACWLLRDVHEFSYAEIAAIVQLPESTIRGRIARARRFLAEGMQPWR
ncbi:RNA polymerase sigma factor [Arthrobacter agilis]|uniref:RNA polymerase sigma factor n=1 Tax=Arthrobacter agilis TaxID=37921 RepID=UPI0027878BB9|nr:RNA polymerase sigma factor [Arthrobacter agilis]MDQ0734859.1 RNA polymerase sigma-70 factor (ECF subfamily) [Arthrobacter agilis]